MGSAASNPLFACCCPEDDETRLLREEEMRCAVHPRMHARTPASHPLSALSYTSLQGALVQICRSGGFQIGVATNGPRHAAETETYTYCPHS
jgi:hypothetical protein